MRAPEDCHTMEELRAAIDVLDKELVGMLARRAAYIDRASQIKEAVGLPANIPVRVEEVVAKVRQNALEVGIDAELTETLWRRLIAWSIAREEQTLGPDTPTE